MRLSPAPRAATHELHVGTVTYRPAAGIGRRCPVSEPLRSACAEILQPVFVCLPRHYAEALLTPVQRSEVTPQAGDQRGAPADTAGRASATAHASGEAGSETFRRLGWRSCQSSARRALALDEPRIRVISQVPAFAEERTDQPPTAAVLG
jgi:hypothetical protein